MCDPAHEIRNATTSIMGILRKLEKNVQCPISMIPPTRSGIIRKDAGGDGHFGARRSKTDDKGRTIHYRHRGTDWACKHKEEAISPISGRIFRPVQVYEKDSRWWGLEIINEFLVYHLYYLDKLPDIIGKTVDQKQLIGHAQDISKKYPGSGVTCHLHGEIKSINPEIFIGA